jgi:hypothetical protein
MAYERGGNFLEDARKKLNREAIGRGEAVFP